VHVEEPTAEVAVSTSINTSDIPVPLVLESVGTGQPEFDILPLSTAATIDFGPPSSQSSRLVPF
jgi:hypothetical protein